MRSVRQIYHDKELIQKLWQTFRIGQTTYVAYLIGIINFTLILYRLGGIDKHMEPLPFAFLLVVILLPTGILLGILHIRKQIPIEQKIITHHNPYMYKNILSSKESMATKTTLWNFDQVKVANNFISFQADMNKKLWEAMNELSQKKVFTDEDMKQMDSIKEQAELIKKGVDDWKPKYQKLFEGKAVAEIPGFEEYVELDENNK